jgi:hypothetical protein
MSGTSMAAPHVAGVVALLAAKQWREGRPLSAAELIRRIESMAIPVPGLDPVDVGLGLVQSPSSGSGKSPVGALAKAQIPVDRRKRRALVHVSDVTDSPGRRAITLLVPRWKEGKPVTLDEEVFPSDCRPLLKKGAVFIASVNTEASRTEDLSFEDLTLLADPD